MRGPRKDAGEEQHSSAQKTQSRTRRVTTLRAICRFNNWICLHDAAAAAAAYGWLHGPLLVLHRRLLIPPNRRYTFLVLCNAARVFDCTFICLYNVSNLCV